MTYAVVDGPFGSFLDRVRVNGISADATGIQRRKCRRTRQTTDVGCQNALFASSHRCVLEIGRKGTVHDGHAAGLPALAGLIAGLKAQRNRRSLKPLPLLDAPRY